MRSGYSRCLVSTKAGQTVRICSMVSSVTEHSLQDGSSMGLSLWRLDQVKKSNANYMQQKTKNKVGTQNMKMCSDVNNMVGTPHM